MITGNYKCPLCHKEYPPTKRGRQIYCSTQCCKKANYHKNKGKKVKSILPSPYKSFTKKEEIIPSLEAEVLIPEPPKKTEIEKVSGAGIANAALGSLLADGAKATVKHVFGSRENQPATKNDTNELKKPITQRYFKIQNLNPRIDGAIPHFDMLTRSLVYFPDPNYRNSAIDLSQ